MPTARAGSASRPSRGDEAPRPGTTVETLAKLKPAFRGIVMLCIGGGQRIARAAD